MYSSYKTLWVLSVILASVITITKGYTITVDAHAEECFFENVEADTKMGTKNMILYEKHISYYSTIPKQTLILNNIVTLVTLTPCYCDYSHKSLKIA